MARLAGRRLLLTRSAEDAADWAGRLAREGARTVVVPCIRTEPIEDPALAARLDAALAQADWLVFTSRRGVDACADLHGAAIPAATRLAAVGAATGERLIQRCGRVDRVGDGTAAALAAELAGDASIRGGARCVLVLAANAGDILERTLTEAGAAVERFDVYRTLPAEPVEPRQPLSALDCDTVLFASPSAVTGFANQVNVDLGAQMVTIGPSTSAAVRERHWEVTAEAKEPSLSGIIESLLEKNCV